MLNVNMIMIMNFGLDPHGVKAPESLHIHNKTELNQEKEGEKHPPETNKALETYSSNRPKIPLIYHKNKAKNCQKIKQPKEPKTELNQHQD